MQDSNTQSAIFHKLCSFWELGDVGGVVGDIAVAGGKGEGDGFLVASRWHPDVRA